MSSSYTARLGAISAIIAGAMWVVIIPLLGWMLPNTPGFSLDVLLFFTAPLFAALGLIGLGQRLAGHTGRLRSIGGVLAVIAAVASVVNVIYYTAVAGPGVEIGGPTNLTIPAAAVGLIGSAITLGIVSVRARVLPRWAAPLPLAIGILSVPTLLIVGLVANRLFPTNVAEPLPAAMMGLAWLALGYGLLAPDAREVAAVPRAA